jgi:4-diphosphocytidyl-2-C-methyl-D-erythritol kinase
MSTLVRSYSKINLGLAIGPPRADGFHELVTLYQTLDLHDLVTVTARRGPVTRITLTTNDPHVPTDQRNTAWKMADLVLKQGIGAEVDIHIEKHLPIQGGMGAGSANAAAALIGLERELRFTMNEGIRRYLAAEVGSDVPLFLVGGAVHGRSRGEQVMPWPDFPATDCVIAIPEVRVSTPQAFHDWDQRQYPGFRAQGPDSLTSGPHPDRLEELSLAYASVFSHSATAVLEEIDVASDASGIVRGPVFESSPEKKQADSEDASLPQGSTLNGLAENPLLALVRTGIENDFEQVVFPQYPLLREIKHELMGTSADRDSGAIFASLSGSGSALFGLYRSEADAKAAQQRVQASGCKALLTKTLPRAEYWRTMFAE